MSDRNPEQGKNKFQFNPEDPMIEYQFNVDRKTQEPADAEFLIFLAVIIPIALAAIFGAVVLLSEVSR